MSIHIKCVACDTEVKAREKYAGRVGKCPMCGMKIAVPRLDAEVTGGDDPPSNEAREIVETVDFEPLGEAPAHDLDDTRDY